MTINVANITTAPTLAYASVGNSAITSLTLCNYSGNTVAVSLYVVPNGGTADNTNIMLSSLQITANDTYQIYAAAEKIILGNGDTVYATANINSSVTSITSYTTI